MTPSIPLASAKKKIEEAVSNFWNRKGQVRQKASPPIQPQRASAERISRRFAVGLDLGATSLKWVQLGLVDGKIQVVDLGQESVTHLAGLPEPRKQEQLGEVLRQVVKKPRLSGRASLSLPMEDASLRLLKMPALPEEELEQAIRWQIEQVLPAGVSYEEITVDYATLQQEADNQWESRVLVATASRRRGMSLVNQLSHAGLQPLAIEPAPFAMAACVERQHPFALNETVLLVHLGASASALAVVMKGQVIFGQPIPVTGVTLTKAVAEQLRVPADQAELLKRTHGLLASAELATAPVGVSDEKVSVAQALASPLENLVLDLLQGFKNFSQQVTQSHIQKFDRVYLSGGPAQLPGLPVWLTARLGVPVETVDPFTAIPMCEAAAQQKPRNAAASNFAVAMGLALWEVPQKP